MIPTFLSRRLAGNLLVAMLAVFLLLAAKLQVRILAMPLLHIIAIQIVALVAIARLHSIVQPWKFSLGEYCKTDSVLRFLLLFVSWLVLSGMFNRVRFDINPHLAVIVTAPAFYLLFRNLDDEVIGKAAFWAFLGFLPFAMGFNENVAGMSLIGLSIVSMAWLPRASYFLIVGASVFSLTIGFQGAIFALAALVACSVHWTRRNSFFTGGIMACALLCAYLSRGNGAIASRLGLWSSALSAFQQSPFIGMGPGFTFRLLWDGEWGSHDHAHNTIFTVLAEGGLIGLSLFLMLFLAVARRWSLAPNWSRILLISLGFVSIVDDAMWWWPCTWLIIMALGRETPKVQSDLRETFPALSRSSVSPL